MVQKLLSAEVFHWPRALLAEQGVLPCLSPNQGGVRDYSQCVGFGHRGGECRVPAALPVVDSIGL